MAVVVGSEPSASNARHIRTVTLLLRYLLTRRSSIGSRHVRPINPRAFPPTIP